MQTKIVKRFGSLIGLRPEYEERYIILHKHTFPGVLQRIHDSNIRNYSIFLREKRLFSYYEYTGQNYEEDMQKISLDPTTQEWWKLTDPMQEPLKTRREGEWWAEMEEIYFYSGSHVSDFNVRRFACDARGSLKNVENLVFHQNELSEMHIRKISVFRKEDRIFLYFEYLDTATRTEVENSGVKIERLFSRLSLGEQSMHWKIMREVFHAD